MPPLRGAVVAIIGRIRNPMVITATGIAEAHEQAKPVPLTAQEGLANAKKWECRQDAQANDLKPVCIRHELSPPFEDLHQH